MGGRPQWEVTVEAMRFLIGEVAEAAESTGDWDVDLYVTTIQRTE
jgi:hypothetical protein